MTVSEEYDRLYGKIDEAIKKINPCKVENGTCIRARDGGRNFCCGKYYCSSTVCKHLKGTCSANKPIACRMWLCEEAIFHLTPAQRMKFYRLNNLFNKFIEKHNILSFVRLSKEEIFERNEIK